MSEDIRPETPHRASGLKARVNRMIDTFAIPRTLHFNSATHHSRIKRSTISLPMRDEVTYRSFNSYEQNPRLRGQSDSIFEDTHKPQTPDKANPWRGSHSSRDSATSLASSSIPSHNAHNAHNASCHGSCTCSLSSLPSSPSPSEQNVALQGVLDELSIRMDYIASEGEELTIRFRADCSCKGDLCKRRMAANSEESWRLRPVEIARDVISMLIQVLQESLKLSSDGWGVINVAHNIHWADGLCWGGDASYNSQRDGPITLIAENSWTGENSSMSNDDDTDDVNDDVNAAFETTLSAVLRVLSTIDSSAVLTTQRMAPSDERRSGCAIVSTARFCLAR